VRRDAPAGALSTPAKLGVLGGLYFSQGLPFGFFTQALPLLLRQRGLSLGQIGLTSLLAMPWALKFAWAPAVDRYSLPALGRRKSWILPLQLATVAILVGLAAAPGAAASTSGIMAAFLLLNLASASQDVATDGLAVDLLSPGERGLGNGLQVAGYRVGMVVGGGALLILHERLGARGAYAAMAALTALATLPVLGAREPAPPPAEPSAARGPAFLRRPGAGRLLAVVVTYKFGEAFATGMLRPFLADRGLGLSELGWLLGTVGFVAGLAGALAGGALVNRVGRRRALVGFGLLQAAAVAGYAAAALAGPARGVLSLLCGLEHFAGGMATAALFTCMMDWCAPESAAADYTVQASAVVIATGAASALAGFSAQALGYAGHFALAAALALGSVAVVRLAFPAGAPTERPAREAPSCA
jgi:MFS family permease